MSHQVVGFDGRSQYFGIGHQKVGGCDRIDKLACIEIDLACSVRVYALHVADGILQPASLQQIALLDEVEENLVLQKTQNAMAIRFFTPNAVDRTHLEWTYFGYADDTPEMRKRRLRHLNLGGPAGFVSMEDGCVGGFVERGIATAEAESAIVGMGGAGIESQATRATEAAVRGFWSLWRRMTGL